MLRQGLPLMFIAVSALSVLAAHAEDRLLLKSVNVDLPVGDRTFEGPGSDVANNNCLACHSAGMVLFQPALVGGESDMPRQRIDAFDPGCVKTHLII
jgi:mono/diheme cytochrome c family protein